MKLETSEILCVSVHITFIWMTNKFSNIKMCLYYLWISRSAMISRLKQCGIFTPPVVGSDFQALLMAISLHGSLPPMDLWLVSLVHAMVVDLIEMRKKLGFVILRGNWDLVWYIKDEIMKGRVNMGIVKIWKIFRMVKRDERNRWCRFYRRLFASEWNIIQIANSKRIFWNCNIFLQLQDIFFKIKQINKLK